MDVRRIAAARLRAVVGGVCAALLGFAPSTWAIEFSYSGYVREHLSVNLQDAPERTVPIRQNVFASPNSLIGAENFDKVGGQGELSMARTTLKLDGLLDLGFAQVVGVGRVVREHHTEYERSIAVAGLLPTAATLANAHSVLRRARVFLLTSM